MGLIKNPRPEDVALSSPQIKNAWSNFDDPGFPLPDQVEDKLRGNDK
jgi:hypothetical protein